MNVGRTWGHWFRVAATTDRVTGSREGTKQLAIAMPECGCTGPNSLRREGSHEHLQRVHACP